MKELLTQTTTQSQHYRKESALKPHQIQFNKPKSITATP
jgi:hypothetical protein